MNSEVRGGRWIPMREASSLIGVSERGARDWIRRYAVPTRGERPVLIDADALEDKLLELGRSPRNSSGSASEPIDAAYRVGGISYGPGDTALVPTSSMVEQGRVFAEKLAELAQRNEVLALEVGTLRERTEQQAIALLEVRDHADRDRTQREEVERLLAEERDRREQIERERDDLQRRIKELGIARLKERMEAHDDAMPAKTPNVAPGGVQREIGASARPRPRGWLTRLFGLG